VKDMSSRENYLRAIYELTEEGEDTTSTSELSDRLGVSPASVTEAIKKLEDDSLVCRKAYKGFTLSPIGKEKASKMEKKKRTLEEFFRKIGAEDPEEEADMVEHAVSEDAVDRIRSEILDDS
ncbi:MAG: metal-dependent transcriptional regulator, partial [Candidatus Nanohaloarchaea archaeon]